MRGVFLEDMHQQPDGVITFGGRKVRLDSIALTEGGLERQKTRFARLIQNDGRAPEIPRMPAPRQPGRPANYSDLVPPASRLNPASRRLLANFPAGTGSSQTNTPVGWSFRT